MDTLVGFENLGKRLQQLLKNASLKQKDVKAATGISQNSISNYVNGGIPKPEPLHELSKFFKIKMEWLLTGEDKTKYIRDEEIQLIQTYRTLNEKQQENVKCYLVGITNAFEGFDKRLKLLIENGGYHNHEELAKEANLPENSISRYLKGGSLESKNLYQLSNFFELPMEWFLRGEVIIEGFSEEENQFIRNYRMLKLKEQGEIVGYMNGIRDELSMTEEGRRAYLSREEELKEIVIKMLQHNASDDFIQSVTDISDGVLEEIKKELNS